MDKGGKGKKKLITITKTSLANKLGAKTFYIKSKFSSLYLDGNHTGDSFLTEEKIERDVFTKWIFQASDSQGVYLLKNLKTELYLTTNEEGDTYNSFLDEDSTYQKWMVMSTSESEIYVIVNMGNNLCLNCSKSNNIGLISLKTSQYEDASNDILFRVFQFKAKK
jgi:hypothetical protein